MGRFSILFVRSALAAAVLCSVPSAVAAQTAPDKKKPKLDQSDEQEAQTGTRIPAKTEAMLAAEAAVVGKRMAGCVYRSSRRNVLKFMNHVDLGGSTNFNKEFVEFAESTDFSTCLGVQVLPFGFGSITFSLPVMRDVLAEEIYLSSHSSPPAPPPAGLVLQPRYVSEGANLERAKLLHSFADCAILQNLNGADAVLRTKPASSEERLAARALAPALSACLTEGQQIKLNTRSIRSLVAYAMWFRFARVETQAK